MTASSNRLLQLVNFNFPSLLSISREKYVPPFSNCFTHPSHLPVRWWMTIKSRQDVMKELQYRAGVQRSCFAFNQDLIKDDIWQNTSLDSTHFIHFLRNFVFHILKRRVRDSRFLLNNDNLVLFFLSKFSFCYYTIFSFVTVFSVQFVTWTVNVALLVFKTPEGQNMDIMNAKIYKWINKSYYIHKRLLMTSTAWMLTNFPSLRQSNSKCFKSWMWNSNNYSKNKEKIKYATFAAVISPIEGLVNGIVHNGHRKEIQMSCLVIIKNSSLLFKILTNKSKFKIMSNKRWKFMSRGQLVQQM